MNPFGNSDDPVVPDWFWPSGPKWARQFFWLYLRNPLHNFTHYYIGFTGKEFARTPCVQDCTNFKEPRGWHTHWIHYKDRAFPFISYQNSKIQAYVGWRADGSWGGPTLRRR